MESFREDGTVITEVLSSQRESDLKFAELKNCETLPEDIEKHCAATASYQLDGDCERIIDDSNISSDENYEDVEDIFGGDWIGKPGVSSDSEDDFPREDIVPVTKKKRVRGKAMPSNISVIEGDPTKYKCTICVKIFSYKGHIRYHAYCGQLDKPFKCHLCSKSFSKKTSLTYHIKTHTGERPFGCLICNKSFLQMDKLKRHQTTHYGNRIECKQCGKKFRDSYSLNVHKRVHSESDLLIYKCDSCSKRFKDKSILNKHVKGVHSDTKQFFCEYCGKGFFWKYNLVCHVRTHSGVRAYSCSECKKTFKNYSDHQKHKLTHTDKREYKCEVCQGDFKRRDNLIRHLRNIHPEINVKNASLENSKSCPSTSTKSENKISQQHTKTIVSKQSKRSISENCSNSGDPGTLKKDLHKISSNIFSTPCESTRLRNNESSVLFKNQGTLTAVIRISNESSGIPSNTVINPGESTGLPSNTGRIESCGIPSCISRIPGESSRVPSIITRVPGESSRIPDEPSNILVNVNRVSEESNSFHSDRIVSNQNVILFNPNRNYVGLHSESNGILNDFESISGHSNSNDREMSHDSNRISVIKNLTPSQSSTTAQQSVIKHSRHPPSSPEQRSPEQRSPEQRSQEQRFNFDCLREGVIKSTQRSADI